MSSLEEMAKRFVSLHRGPAPLLIPNPWDVGSAKVLVAMGFEALAATSGGFAATLGRVDGSVSLRERVASQSTCRDSKVGRARSLFM